MKKYYFIICVILGLFIFLIGLYQKLWWTRDYWQMEQRDPEPQNNNIQNYTKSNTTYWITKWSFWNFAKKMDSTSLYDKDVRMQENIGFKVGADQDINLFRENIYNWYIPNPEVLTYNWVFSDYHFDLPDWECKTMLCPLVTSSTIHSLSWGDEQRLQIWLWSNIKQSDFKRLPTNFVVVIDRSGSMWSPINEYYYDNIIKEDKSLCNDELYFAPWEECISKDEKEIYLKSFEEKQKKTKIQLAMEAVSNMIDKLQDTDKIGIVLYDDNAEIAHELIDVKKIDKQTLKNHLLKVYESWWTNTEEWLRKWIELFNDMKEWYQNRVILLTDAMPNLWDYSEKWLGKIIEDASNKWIYFSFLGVWVDFQQQFIQKIWKYKWNNYFYIWDWWWFNKRLVEEFDYNFFPMIFNISMETNNKDQIEKIYWLDNSWNDLIKINTLFPTPPTVSWYRWSIILLKLKSNTKNLTFKVSYEKYDWKKEEIEKSVDIDSSTNPNIQKWVLLTYYIDQLKNSINTKSTKWLENMKKYMESSKSVFKDEDEKMLDKEIQTLDALTKLILNNTEIKPNYDPKWDIEK